MTINNYLQQNINIICIVLRLNFKRYSLILYGKGVIGLKVIYYIYVN